LQAREPLYEEVADVRFETGSAPVHHAVRHLLSLLKERGC
jgi:shikimate kinase